MEDIPILVLGYRRPQVLVQCLEQIRRSGFGDVYVNIDGPRPEKPEEQDLIAQCHEVVATFDGSLSIRRRFASAHLGLDAGVVNAVTWFYEANERGLVVEDDVLIDPSCMRLAQSMFDFLGVTPNVGSLTLHSIVPQRKIKRPELAYRLSRLPSSQFWGTTRDRWFELPATLENWRDTLSEEQLKEVGGAQFSRYWTRRFDSALATNSVTWEFKWLVAHWSRDWTVAISNTNHALNVGFDRSASSIQHRPSWFPTWIDPVPTTIDVPELLEVDERADQWSMRQGLGLGPIKAVKRSLRGLLGIRR